MNCLFIGAGYESMIIPLEILNLVYEVFSVKGYKHKNQNEYKGSDLVMSVGGYSECWF